MDWRFVWIFSLILTSMSEAAPGEDSMLGDLFGTSQMMANHVPRLGRRSLSPFRSKGFRFFGSGGGDRGGSGVSDRGGKLAGFFGPLYRYDNFRFYGGRPGEELARGLLRDKRMEEEYSDMMLPNVAADNVGGGGGVETALDKATSVSTKLAKAALPAGSEKESSNISREDQDYWKNVLSEATINTVLQKMAEIGETREMIEDFNKYEKYGVGNPLPKYLARHQPLPAMSPKVKVESSYPKTNEGILSKYRSYLPFPRRRRRIPPPLKRRSNYL